jgi:hypothetical protein
MKRHFLLISSSLLLAGSAHAQLGLRVGGNATGVTSERILSDEGTVYRSRIGYQVGVFYAQALTKRLSLVPEVQFSRERQAVYIDGGSPSLRYHSNYDLRLSYVNVPILLRVALGPVYLEAGPQVSLLVGGSGKGSTSSTDFQGVGAYFDIDQVATDRYRRFDAGPCLGVGIKLLARLGLSLRAYQSLVARSPDNYQYSTNQISPIPYTAGAQHRQMLQASLTYQLSAHQ